MALLTDLTFCGKSAVVLLVSCKFLSCRVFFLSQRRSNMRVHLVKVASLCDVALVNQCQQYWQVTCENLFVGFEFGTGKERLTHSVHELQKTGRYMPLQLLGGYGTATPIAVTRELILLATATNRPMLIFDFAGHRWIRKNGEKWLETVSSRSGVLFPAWKINLQLFEVGGNCVEIVTTQLRLR